MILVNLLRSDCFGKLDIVENVVDNLFVVVLNQFLLHICLIILVMISLLKVKILYFVVFQLLFFVSLIQVVYF